MEKHFNILSGILAFLVYAVLLGLLLNYFNHHHSRKPLHFVAKNDNRIVVSLSSLPEKTKSPHRQKKPKIQSKPKKKPSKKVKEKSKKLPEKEKIVPKTVAEKTHTKISEEKSKNKKPDLHHLFDKVKEKRPVVKKKKKQTKKTDQQKKEKNKGIENAYFAKVESMLQNWPAQSDFAGEKIKVWLRIKQDGSFTFRILSASGNEAFNNELIAYLKQLQKIGFGGHQNSRPYELNVEFIAKE